MYREQYVKYSAAGWSGGGRQRRVRETETSEERKYRAIECRCAVNELATRFRTADRVIASARRGSIDKWVSLPLSLCKRRKKKVRRKKSHVISPSNRVTRRHAYPNWNHKCIEFSIAWKSTVLKNKHTRSTYSNYSSAASLGMTTILRSIFRLGFDGRLMGGIEGEDLRNGEGKWD